MPTAVDHVLVEITQLVVSLGARIVPAPAVLVDEIVHGCEDEGGVGVDVVVFPLVDVCDLGGRVDVLRDAVAACVDEPIAFVRAGEGAGDAALFVLLHRCGVCWAQEAEGEGEDEEESVE